ncbi:MAG: hypothetical protein A3C90_03720 [Candidatus Magasanikbacteria bacterium RIFCSPHIGHO2_02_FULL_51_14]|uniref:DUF218 domain-containing protein n=1 Tax=Candidatus Magasanikbacteria bacterium RIFCSPHIGHO2_02_FULL_51_14 TaxID=1798683 RepID=A0A1F6MDA1_9BACT|nr:MAG: hypothetical protein A3C90_03720 [Candidatus Magasanikbacteria bacterium RIFCSPHIGHO2_02_FULL_51_14]
MKVFFHRMHQFSKKHWKKATILFVATILLLSALTLYASKTILAYESYIVEDVDAGGEYPIAMIFGGGMIDENTMTEMQRDRVMKGIELYVTGKVLGLLLTGDDGTRWKFDEVGSMKELVQQYGVSDDRILVDAKGSRTYESCKNASEDFHVNKAVVISQRFHLPRILYICRNMGIDAVGIAADLSEYEDRWTPGVRETLARFKAWVEITVKKPWLN